MSYKNSRIYQLGYELSLKVEKVCQAFPQHEQYCLGQQLRKSSRSLVANYVEGYIRQIGSQKDHKRFLVYSKGSCDETKYWLEQARDIGHLTEPACGVLLRGYDELGRLIYSLLRR